VAKKIQISDDDIRDIITPELDRAKDWQTQLSDERRKCRELYDMMPLGNEVDGFSQTVESTVFECVEWLKPGLSDIFGHPDFFVVKMRNAEQADRIKEITRHQLFTQQEGTKVIRDYLDSALKYHFSVLKVCYVEEFDDVEEEYARLTMEEAQMLASQGAELSKYDEVQGFDGATGQPVQWLENVKVVRREIKFRGPKVMPIPPWEFFISPGAKDIDSARLVAHCVPRTLHDIKVGENSGIYKKGSFAKLKDKAGEAAELPEYLDERAHVYEQDGLTIDEVATNSSVTPDHKSAIPSRSLNVWEIYTSLDIDNDGLLEPVIVRMAEDEILSVEENPYKRPPFRAGRLIEISHRFEGRALPLVLEDDQKELTNLSRLFVDSAAESAYATAVTSDQGFLAQWANRSIGDAFFVQGDVNSKVAFERSPGADPNVLKAIELKEGKVERKSGVSRYNQGIDADSLNKTATGISIISSAGQQRQKFGARILGEPLAHVLRDMIKINKLWPPYIEDADLQPEQGLFNAQLSIEIEVGVGPQDRMAQSQFLAQHQQWLTGFAIPQGLAGPEHSIKCQAKIGKLQGVPFDDLMRSPEDMDSIQQMQQQMQQMGQQLEQVGQQTQEMQQFIQKLQGEKQQLELKASSQSPELEQMKLQADMTVERAKIEADMIIEREKMAMDAQLAREKMAIDAQVAAMRPAPQPKQQQVL
jgi:hypothetical protein